MLTLSKMSGGQGQYYLELAREDYYLKGGEPPGYWLGEGAASFGLVGKVDKEDLRRLFQGYSPEGKPLVQNAGDPGRQAGWDLTFSAPKSVSVAWSQAGKVHSDKFRAAHADAVKAAMAFLEREGSFTRRGKGGALREHAKLVCAAFEHGTSRAQDPQLHTHVLVMNTCVREDGTTGTLTSPEFYKLQMTAGALYRAELARGIEQRLGLSTEKRGNTFELPCVPKKLVELFSKRRQEIQRLLEEKGLRSPRAAEVANLATRGRKELVSREELKHKWRETGREAGWSTPELLQAITREAALLRWKLKGRSDPATLCAKVLEKALEELTASQSHFSRGSLIRKLAENAQGTGLGISDLLQTADHYLEQDAHALGIHHGEPRYTTQGMLELERQLLSTAQHLTDPLHCDCGGALNQADIQVALSGNSILNAEQRKAIWDITSSTLGLSGVHGMAGTGKTTMLRVVREAFELGGRRVLGAALSGKAAEELSHGAGIKSSTIASLLYRLDHPPSEIERHLINLGRTALGIPGFMKQPPLWGKPRPLLSKGDVLVIDEAGMVGTRDMARILSHCERAQARVILVGDPDQLQPIQAGGPFAYLAKQISFSKLTQIVRQDELWQREAVTDFATGKAGRALSEFNDRGLVDVQDDKEGAREALLEAWKEKGLRKPEDHFILAGRRKDVAILNHEIQNTRLKEGLLGDEHVTNANATFYAGDRVLFTRNAKLKGFRNGHMGTVLEANYASGYLIVRRDHDRKKVCVLFSRYDDLSLGYAATTHKAQGMTAKNVYVLTDEVMQDLHLSYVQASRARMNTRFFTTRDEAGGEDLCELAHKMSKDRLKLLAHELDDLNRARELAETELPPPPKIPDHYTRHHERSRSY